MHMCLRFSPLPSEAVSSVATSSGAKATDVTGRRVLRTMTGAPTASPGLQTQTVSSVEHVAR
jgi:hypothetical protein